MEESSTFLSLNGYYVYVVADGSYCAHVRELLTRTLARLITKRFTRH